jgi:acetyl-CoA acetyltransferase
MSDVYVIGAFSTPFKRWPDKSYKHLTREAVDGVLADAGIDGDAIGAVWFGNCGMWVENQGSVRGQVCLTPLIRERRLPAHVPVTNVEGGCATASLAFLGAAKDVLTGDADMALAIGVEKTFHPDRPDRAAALFNGGIDQFDPQEWQSFYAAAGRKAGKEFAPGPDRTVFMDTYAMQACYHMKRYGTTQRQIAIGAAKNHTHGAKNPNAQYRFEMTAEQVLADRPISYPLTRAMCAPIGDGAAAALVCSAAYLKTLPSPVQARAVRVLGHGVSSGVYRDLDEPGLSHYAAKRAYSRAGIAPGDVDVVELHDATSFCEVFQLEMLGLCEAGQGGATIERGDTTLGGRLPVNTSGGLVSKGHPVGATGLSMIQELVTQLRGEAGPRQVDGARIALAENGGGVVGFDEAACTVIVLGRDG